MVMAETEFIFDQKERELLLRLASLIRSKGLETAAVFILEAHKPFAFIISSAIAFFEPFIRLFFRLPEYNKLIELSENRQAIEYVILCLEDGEMYLRESEAIKIEKTECPNDSD
jgi:hypothetical protein